ncbi:hypothetical protein TTHERM_000992843 (macronuclear) [Tetrahymena thermophila SB210]|uniref:Uncharacterized protein n=1 Tax=Tetrahymena thermophila (strain SB210) TaxID=312017 RepID=W7XFX1_TETTS|nr:hypothetical protein TTHERM_000992843 [Tetrahymena thermophila SB210]EWS71729.1 hypothetical protein TTHERM_000992843 [Tetrahymena thermophila SB210]|eukprot:XP_012655737.1 hypothetical protein TTHERM_000992843 [Tetrahymena thermophila SB210]
MLLAHINHQKCGRIFLYCISYCVKYAVANEWKEIQTSQRDINQLNDANLKVSKQNIVHTQLVNIVILKQLNKKNLDYMKKLTFKLDKDQISEVNQKMRIPYFFNAKIFKILQKSMQENQHKKYFQFGLYKQQQIQQYQL